MNWLRTLLKKYLPFWLIVKINALRGYSYSEKEDLTRRRVNFYRLFLNKGDLVFDVGANYGNRVTPFLQLSCRVVAVEPLPDCFRYLNYKFGKKIQIENVCLGAAKGESDLYVGKINSISTLSSDFIARTTKSGRFEEDSWQERIKVTVSTLDELIRKYGVPKFIKIDTEGYEIEVLKGLSENVPHLSFEYTLPEFEKELIDILAVLNLKGLMEINLSVGEEMSFAFEKWMALDEFLVFLQNNKSKLEGWGDIYVRFLDIGSSTKIR